jgi:hypothetical protein
MSNSPLVSIHRYPVKSVVADYLRAAAGMALTLGPLVFFNLVAPMVYILGGLGALFLVFGIRTLLRQLAFVEVSAEGVTMGGPAGSAVLWQNLDAMSLHYYTTRRDKQGGWMQLKIRQKSRTMALDSSLPGFDGIVAQAFHAARANGVELDARTLANLPSLGIAMPEDGP